MTAACEAMPWLTPADRAAVDLAKSYAAAIDGADDVTKALYLGPHLLKTLTELGGSPAGRKLLALKEEARDKLASVRDLRSRPAPSKKRA